MSVAQVLKHFFKESYLSVSFSEVYSGGYDSDIVMWDKYESLLYIQYTNN